MMNFIACTDDCIYQKDGECRLDRAASRGQDGSSNCAYCVPKCGAESKTKQARGQ